MPGQDRCLRCGSVLEAGEAFVDVHPPRMAGWKRPFRSAVRRLRLLGIIPDITGRVCDETAVKSRELMIGLGLSVIPGLAQIVAVRFREIRWYLPGWLVAFTVGIFLYGSGMGLVLLGLAAGLHAWMAFAHTLHKLLDEIYEKLMGMALLIVAAAVLYWGIRTSVFADFVWGYTSLTIPRYNIETGDCLLARRSLSNNKTLPRGHLAMTRLQETGRERWEIMSNCMMTEIVGLPGERIQLADDIFSINGGSDCWRRVWQAGGVGLTGWGCC